MPWNPTLTVAYLVLFAGVGFVFVFAALLIGWFLRGRDRTPEKLQTYECGEPPIGSSQVRFDLRFYVIALVFIVFDVEVAFFFPWATVFGKATQLMDPDFQKVAATAAADSTGGVQPIADANATVLADGVRDKLRELGVREPTVPPVAAHEVAGEIERGAAKLAWTAVADISVFFAVLLVGFAYVWKQGDLSWVRAYASDEAAGQVSVGQAVPDGRNG